MVAQAAPETPISKDRMNSRSSRIFKAVETARNISGMTELPIERARDAKKLYRKVNRIPQKII